MKHTPAKQTTIIVDIEEVVKLLVQKNMVLHAPTSSSKSQVSEITILGDDSVEHECPGSIYRGLHDAIEAGHPFYANLEKVFMQEPDTAATWCIIAKSNTAARKFIVPSDMLEPKAKPEAKIKVYELASKDKHPASHKLAWIIKEASRIHEESYDIDAANAAAEKAEAEKAADPDNIYAGIVFFNKFYRKSFDQAAQEAATKAGEPQLAEIVSLLLYTGWNDANDWANRNAQ